MNGEAWEELVMRGSACSVSPCVVNTLWGWKTITDGSRESSSDVAGGRKNRQEEGEKEEESSKTKRQKEEMEMKGYTEKK